jgi:hypothetical protein
MKAELSLGSAPAFLDRHGPIFIVGCPRSGTTFLSSCIGRINEIEQFSGVLATPRMMHLIGMLASQGNPLVDLLLWNMRDTFWHAFNRRIYFGGERVAEVVYGRKPWHWIFRRPTMEGRYFSYKEPFLAFAIREVCAHFPASKVVHIIRDGRDNADSMVRRYPDALSDKVLDDHAHAMNKNSEIGIPKPYGDRFVPWWVESGHEERFLDCSKYGRYVWMWREMVTRTRNCGEQLGPDRYLEMRYESVVTESKQNAKTLLNFLGFEASRSMLRRLEKGRASSIGISRKNQPAKAIDEANGIAGQLLKTLDYA